VGGEEVKQMLDEEGAQRSFNQMMELFVTPEINRRKEAGTLPSNFRLWAAQVVFCPDWKRPLIRLNEEAKIQAKAKIKDAVPGSMISINAIEEIVDLRLPDDEESQYGHVTILRFKDHWLYTFDFRYNKGLAREHAQVAKQFLELARYARESQFVSPFIDNLFSCVELCARSELLLIPDKKFKQKAAHSTVKSKHNRFLGKLDPNNPFNKMLNELSAIRNNARYLRNLVKISASKSQEYLETAQEMLVHLEAKLRKH
jgi:hypothetical protein